MGIVLDRPIPSLGRQEHLSFWIGGKAVALERLWLMVGQAGLSALQYFTASSGPGQCCVQTGESCLDSGKSCPVRRDCGPGLRVRQYFIGSAQLGRGSNPLFLSGITSEYAGWTGGGDTGCWWSAEAVGHWLIWAGQAGEPPLWWLLEAEAGQ